MTKEHVKTERKTLILALVAGVCGNAMLAGLTVSQVAFSIFPVIAMVLAVQSLYQEYLRKPMPEGTPLMSLACFFVGAFGYSAFVRMLNPEMGSNYFSIIITMSLLLWVAVKAGILDTSSEKDAATE
ncbi:YijD family membrane protein [Vibrio sp. Of7-15]|uniref:YijD family membrane protein n=1 Tax=Vibrio sp. Of7-15 TaxID=2724879 RepID=UPI001EF1E066|nr:YijD family membrane protein [Vibrio sp. Of7-15]MCG7498935.1 YijD family membrane protein [Vibrio sp. Of7-15]